MTNPTESPEALSLKKFIKDWYFERTKNIKGLSNPTFDVWYDNGDLHLRFSCGGYSPTLHYISILHDKWLKGKSGHEYEEDMINIMEPLIVSQEARYRTAQAIDPSRKEGYLPLSQIDHLLVERHFKDLCGKPNPRKSYHEAVRRLHAETRKYTGKSYCIGQGVIIAESLDGTPIQRMVMPNICFSSKVKLVGFTLEIKTDHLPDSIINSAQGRELGNVIEIHPLINDRKIKAIKNSGERIVNIQINLDFQPVSEILLKEN